MPLHNTYNAVAVFTLPRIDERVAVFLFLFPSNDASDHRDDASHAEGKASEKGGMTGAFQTAANREYRDNR